MKFKVFHSSASSAAHRHPREHTRPLGRPALGQDERASQRVKVPKKGPGSATKVEVSVSKDGYAKIPGTRIQKIRGGKAVRVVEEDGKTFAPDKVKAAEAWLVKLVRIARKKQQADSELAAVHAQAAALHRSDPPPAATTEQAPAAQRRPAKALVKAVQPLAGSGTKKARRAEARRHRQRSGAEEHQTQATAGGRQLVDEERRDGEVVQRDRGRAWVRLLLGQSLPDPLRERFRVHLGAARAAATAAAHEPICAGVSGDVVAVAYRDITEGDLQPGARVSLRLFTEAQGVGGCDARAGEQPARAGEKRPAEDEAPPGKRRKTATKETAKDKAAPQKAKRAMKSKKKRKQGRAASTAPASESRAAASAMASTTPAAESLAGAPSAAVAAAPVAQVSSADPSAAKAPALHGIE